MKTTKMVVYKKIKAMISLENVRVGDQIEIPLKGFGVFTATAYKVTGAGVLFIFDNCVTKRRMNSNNSINGGYSESEISSWIQNVLFEALPDELKSITREFAIPTYGQIFGHDHWYEEAVEADEDKRIALMKIRKNRICMYNNETCWYWLRNATKKGEYFNLVNYNGDAYCDDATFLGGIRPTIFLKQ